MYEAELFIAGLKVKVTGDYNRPDPDVGIMSCYFDDVAVMRTNGLPLENGFCERCINDHMEEIQEALSSAADHENYIMEAEQADDRDYYLDC
jgi:hypothetical protein